MARKSSVYCWRWVSSSAPYWAGSASSGWGYVTNWTAAARTRQLAQQFEQALRPPPPFHPHRLSQARQPPTCFPATTAAGAVSRRAAELTCRSARTLAGVPERELDDLAWRHQRRAGRNLHGQVWHRCRPAGSRGARGAGASSQDWRCMPARNGYAAAPAAATRCSRR